MPQRTVQYPSVVYPSSQPPAPPVTVSLGFDVAPVQVVRRSVVRQPDGSDQLIHRRRGHQGGENQSFPDALIRRTPQQVPDGGYSWPPGRFTTTNNAPSPFVSVPDRVWSRSAVQPDVTLGYVSSQPSNLPNTTYGKDSYYPDSVLGRKGTQPDGLAWPVGAFTTPSQVSPQGFAVYSPERLPTGPVRQQGEFSYFIPPPTKPVWGFDAVLPGPLLLSGNTTRTRNRGDSLVFVPHRRGEVHYPGNVAVYPDRVVRRLLVPSAQPESVVLLKPTPFKNVGWGWEVIDRYLVRVRGVAPVSPESWQYGTTTNTPAFVFYTHTGLYVVPVRSARYYGDEETLT